MQNLCSVAGLIRRDDGAFCAVQRGSQGRFKGCWEFPGGKIKDGETAIECLVRELYDELGILVEISDEGPAVWHQFHDAERGETLMHLQSFYCVCSKFREPQLREHTNIKWGRLNEFLDIPLTPSDEKLLLSLINNRKERGTVTAATARAR